MVLFIYSPSELELAIYIVRAYIGFLILHLPSTGIAGYVITLTWVLYWNWQCAGFPSWLKKALLCCIGNLM